MEADFALVNLEAFGDLVGEQLLQVAVVSHDQAGPVHMTMQRLHYLLTLSRQNESELPSMYQEVWSATFCQLPS